jgi:hypothetical protein
MSGIAFKPEEATEALKEFVGQIVAVDYSLEPFGFKGAPDIRRDTKVLGLQIRTEAYEKEQYEWYRNAVSPLPPQSAFESKEDESRRGYSSIVKWLYFIEALNETGAMRDVSVAGANDEERMQNFARSLLGMVFRWQEKECESLVKIRGGEFKKFNVLLPVEYLGKKPIEAAPEVKQVSLEESAPKKEGID